VWCGRSAVAALACPSCRRNRPKPGARRHAGRPGPRCRPSLGPGVTDRVLQPAGQGPPSCERCAPLRSELTAPWAPRSAAPARHYSHPMPSRDRSRTRDRAGAAVLLPAATSSSSSCTRPPSSTCMQSQTRHARTVGCVQAGRAKTITNNIHTFELDRRCTNYPHVEPDPRAPPCGRDPEPGLHVYKLCSSNTTPTRPDTYARRERSQAPSSS
jgi:hypothetical protein